MIDNVKSINLPTNYQDMIFYVEVLNCKLQTGDRTKSPLVKLGSEKKLFLCSVSKETHSNYEYV